MKKHNNLEIKEEIQSHGYKILPNIILEMEELSSCDKMVYMVLFNMPNENQNGDIYPSYEYLSKLIKTNRTTLYRSLKKLKEIGLIDWENRGRGTNFYYLLPIPDWIKEKYSVECGDYKPPTNQLNV